MSEKDDQSEVEKLQLQIDNLSAENAALQQELQVQ